MQTSTLSLIPLNKLVISHLNVRKTTTDVAELAENIAALGVLQNLSVVQKGSKYEVIAGGRRLSALQLLAENKRIAKTYEVPVQVVEASDAIRVSLAENVERENMHPADEFVAFQTLVDSGVSVEDVASQFGVTPQVVNRRLRLANIAPSLMDAFRADEIKLDKLMALATTDNHELQLSVWEDSGSWTTANEMRQKIIQASRVISSQDRIALFVGIDAYTEAGGSIQSDLFSESEGSAFIVDVPLLVQLAQKKLQEIAQDMLQNEEVNWVECSIEKTHYDWASYRKATCKLGTIPAEVKAQIAQIQEQIDAIETQQDEAEEYDQELQDEMVGLEKQIEDLQKPFKKFAKQDLKRMGAYLTIARDGTVDVEQGLIRKSDETKNSGSSQVDGDEEESTPEVTAKPDIPTTLVTALTAHRTIALQAEIAQQPKKALVLLIAKLLFDSVRSYSSPVSILKITGVQMDLTKHDGAIAHSLGHEAIAKKTEKWAYLLESDILIEELAKLSTDHLLELLAVLTAKNYDTVSFSSGENDSYQGVAQFLGFDINKWFTPSAVTFWGKLSKDVLMKKILEKKPDAQGLGKLKRGDLAQMAERLYEGSGYQPDFMFA